jgi:hypothetical protein
MSTREPPPGEESFVRPFLLTGGRTRPRTTELRVETLVRATPAALSAPLKFEDRRIVELCQVPQSVAEIASALRVPLGVVRVLISDLLAGGLVHSEEPDLEISVRQLERILVGLHRL